MNPFQIRTDLALETQEKFKEDNVEIKGVRIKEKQLSYVDLKITYVFIDTENGSKIMGKPRGKYITLEAPHIDEGEHDYQKEVILQLAEILKMVLPKLKKEDSILVVGLGNREVTPDSLGPKVVDQLLITRHILKEFGDYAFGEEAYKRVSGIVPGVMAQTGMETLEIVKGIVEQTNVTCVLAVDALAARSTKRLGRTIQVADTGIVPGSGIGNRRNAIDKESIGVPVIAIGIPTVIDAATIVSDTISHMSKDTDHASGREVCEYLSPALNAMFVTPKDIDESIRQLSVAVAEGINLALKEA